MKFKWANNKSAWYFRPEGYKKKSKRQMSLDEIRDAYGSDEIKVKTKIKLEDAS